MSTSAHTVRNVAIILAVALLVDLVPGGGDGASTVRAALYLAFLATVSWGGTRLYREHREWLYSLGDRNRAVLYVAVGVIVVTVIAKARLWASTVGEFVWIVLIAGSVYAIIQTVRMSRSL